MSLAPVPFPSLEVEAAESAHAQLHRRNVRAYLGLPLRPRGAERAPGVPMVALRNPLPAWKRALDLCVCFAGIPVLAFGTLALVMATRWRSPGPVIFREERVGFAGRRLRVYRFRTRPVRSKTGTTPAMAPTEGRPAHPVPGGALLRVTRFDRLPQLLNVLHGEMSLVGPSPCRPDEYERLSLWQRRRFEALPGLTGLGQVVKLKHQRWDRLARLDIYYSRHLSLTSDVSILVRTLPALVRRNRSGLPTTARRTGESDAGSRS